MNRFVLKGGNLLDLVYNISSRASMDVDVSMAGDFDVGSLKNVEERIQRRIEETFRPEGYEPFDFLFQPKPDQIPPEQTGFWGGYQLEFKLVEREVAVSLGNDRAAMQRQSISVGGKGRVQIDISKHEFVDSKVATEMDGYRIYVYTPAMMVAEKLRAICQQMPEYAAIVKKHRKARARDFVDIHSLVTSFPIQMASQEHRSLIQHVFQAKQVPLRLLRKIESHREFHRLDFSSVIDTVKPGIVLENFDFYFDFVIGCCKQLESLGDE